MTRLRQIAAATTLCVAVAAATPGTGLDPAHAEDDVSPVTIGQTFIAASLDPADGSAGWALTSHGVGQNLFGIDRDGAIVPVLAEAVEADGDGWIVTLRPNRRFSDGAPVTAADVAAALGRTNDRNPAARATGGAMTFTALDDLTLRIVPERPVPMMASLLAEWPMVVYRQTPDGPAFTGPYQVDAFDGAGEITLSPNPHYDDAVARRPDIRLLRFSDAQSLALALQAGELDLAFNLPVEALPRLRADGNLTVRSFPVAYQYMMWMNTRRPALNDAAVRRAIDLAIDRDMLIDAVNGGEVATGAFATFFPFAGDAPRRHDAAEAAALLAAAGWTDGDGDGVRDRDGEDLALSLHAYPQRPDLVSFLPVVETQLESVGIGVSTFVTEAVSQLAGSHDFDLLLWAQHTAPAGDPAFFLNDFLRSGGRNNHSGYANPRYDAVLDAMAATGAPDEREALAREAQDILFADAPVSFLVTPFWHYGTSARLADYEVWGSDYYIIRDDLFVAGE